MKEMQRNRNAVFNRCSAVGKLRGDHNTTTIAIFMNNVGIEKT